MSFYLYFSSFLIEIQGSELGIGWYIVNQVCKFRNMMQKCNVGFCDMIILCDRITGGGIYVCDK